MRKDLWDYICKCAVSMFLSFCLRYARSRTVFEEKERKGFLQAFWVARAGVDVGIRLVWLLVV